MVRYVCLLVLALTRCSSPGETMRTQFPDFWNEVMGEWEIYPEGATRALSIEFSEALKVRDAESFICGKEATPNYWTGQTPAETVFSADQAHGNSAGTGKAALQKMEFKRGQIMVVCNGKKMNYEDHIIFYGLSAAQARMTQQPRRTAEFKYAVIKDEHGGMRKFAYRRSSPASPP